MYGNVPVKSMNIHHFEMDTNDATLKPYDMQTGVTAYAKGQKVIGTGKAFEFASYGSMETNSMDFVPSLINTVEIGSVDYPIKSSITFNNMKNINFAIEQDVGTVTVDGAEYPITITIENSILTFNCEKTITLQFFYGKDNYI